MIKIKEYDVKEIVPKIGTRDRIRLGEYFVRINSNRLKTFKESLKCVGCGKEGNIFILEKSHKNDGSPHLNLYHRNVDNKKDLLFTKDHILPKSKGGSDNLENLQTMCTRCNCKKADKIVN